MSLCMGNARLCLHTYAIKWILVLMQTRLVLLSDYHNNYYETSTALTGVLCSDCVVNTNCNYYLNLLGHSISCVSLVRACSDEIVS